MMRPYKVETALRCFRVSRGSIFRMVWFCLVLWHINHWRLFNAKSISIHINSFISNNSVKDEYTISMSKIVLFQTIQFSISKLFSSIWVIHRTLSGATTLSQSVPESGDNEWAHRIPQSSRITGVSPSDCFVSYPGNSLEEFYQSVYSAGPSDWDKKKRMKIGFVSM